MTAGGNGEDRQRQQQKRNAGVSPLRRQSALSVRLCSG